MMNRYFALVGFALSLPSTSVVAQDASMNGACTADICTCQITYPSLNVTDFEPPSCPEWMDPSNGIYNSLTSGACSPKPGTGIRTCGGTKAPSSVFESDVAKEIQRFTASEDDVGAECLVESWIIQDGTDGPIVVNYTAGAEVPPPCSMDMPFTLAPSMAPTTQSPSQSPTEDSGASSLLSSTGIALLGVIAVLMAGQ